MQDFITRTQNVLKERGYEVLSTHIPVNQDAVVIKFRDGNTIAHFTASGREIRQAQPRVVEDTVAELIEHRLENALKIAADV
jgi:hypothetical protein